MVRSLEPAFNLMVLETDAISSLFPDANKAGMAVLVVNIVKTIWQRPQALGDEFDACSGIWHKHDIELIGVGIEEAKDAKAYVLDARG